MPALSQAESTYELKFLLTEPQAHEAETWARRHLLLDAHGDPGLGGAYRSTSLYFDTRELDVYHGTPVCNGNKFRVRLYGSSTKLFLERKWRDGDRVSKKRTSIPAEELPLLARLTTAARWPGRWFHHSLWSQHLVPACRITYLRTAFGQLNAAGPLRLTLDRDLCGTLTDHWSLTAAQRSVSLLAGRVILELKYRTELPGLFHELVGQMSLSPNAVSKYRRCREAWDAPAWLD
jgi:hypothetical protein